MKRDFNAVLKGYDGAPLRENGEDVKLGSPAVTVLLAQFQDEQGLRGEDKFARYKLAERIGHGGAQDVSAEEIALLKNLIGKAYPPGIVGPAYEALEQDAPATVPAAPAQQAQVQAALVVAETAMGVAGVVEQQIKAAPGSYVPARSR